MILKKLITSILKVKNSDGTKKVLVVGRLSTDGLADFRRL
jgi:hypothetical protein